MSERSKFWLSHLSAIEAGGISTKAYAEREGLSPQALYQWLQAPGGRRPYQPRQAWWLRPDPVGTFDGGPCGLHGVRPHNRLVQTDR